MGTRSKGNLKHFLEQKLVRTLEPFLFVAVTPTRSPAGKHYDWIEIGDFKPKTRHTQATTEQNSYRFKITT